MKELGTLYGVRILADTESDDAAREVRKWLETMDLRYRREGEEKLKTDIANI